MSSRSLMLNGGRYFLMNFCSASSASASLAVATKSIASILSRNSAAARDRLEKCEATRLRIDFALPT